MATVTTARRVDFEIIHEHRHLRRFMDFVVVRVVIQGNQVLHLRYRVRR